MAHHAIERPLVSVEPEEVRQTLERILSSKYFVHAPKKKGFLNLICDFYLKGRAHELNEYILGYDVFGRDNTYDPSADPVVRVTAHEIRKKLELYYQNEGAQDPIRLEIPAGSYQPIFTRPAPVPSSLIAEFPATTPPPVNVNSAQTEAAPSWRRLPFGKLVLGLAVLVLAIFVAGLSLSNRELRRKATMADASKDFTAYGAVWAPFMEHHAPPLVILSNPPVLRPSNASDSEALKQESIELPPKAIEQLKDKIVMNPEVIVKESFGVIPGNVDAPESKAIPKQKQTPRLIFSRDVYTGIGEAIGLHYLTDLFRRVDRNILLKQSRTLSAEDLKNHNVILLGGVWVNEWSGKLTGNEDFIFTGNATIKNRNPQPGEQSEYIPQFDSRTGSLVVDYALITVKPNISEANDVMMLAGVYNQGTEAAAEFVTNQNYLNQLNQRLQQLPRQGGPPRSYQALLKVGVEKGIPTTISILALHELRHSKR